MRALRSFHAAIRGEGQPSATGEDGVRPAGDGARSGAARADRPATRSVVPSWRAEQWLPRVVSADEAAALIPDGAIVTVCPRAGSAVPDAVLRPSASASTRPAIPAQPDDAAPDRRRRHVRHQGHRPHRQAGPAQEVLAGSYPSGPSAEPPAIWRMITRTRSRPTTSRQGILFDMHREAARSARGAHQGRPRHLRRSGPRGLRDERQGAAEPIVSKSSSTATTWLFFPTIAPEVAIIRATTADERGNLSYEHEGGYLGPLDQALAVRNNGGIVIAQVKRVPKAGTLKPHDVPCPASSSTTSSSPGPAADDADALRPGDLRRDLPADVELRLAEWSIPKVIARRGAQELRHGRRSNLGFGISANVPRILIEEGCTAPSPG